MPSAAVLMSIFVLLLSLKWSLITIGFLLREFMISTLCSRLNEKAVLSFSCRKKFYVFYTTSSFSHILEFDVFNNTLPFSSSKFTLMSPGADWYFFIKHDILLQFKLRAGKSEYCKKRPICTDSFSPRNNECLKAELCRCTRVIATSGSSELEAKRFIANNSKLHDEISRIFLLGMSRMRCFCQFCFRSFFVCCFVLKRQRSNLYGRLRNKELLGISVIEI